jgi:hypothetical protein
LATREDTVNHCLRWIALISAVLFLLLVQSAATFAARQCVELKARYYEKNAAIAEEFSVRKFAICRNQHPGWLVFDVSTSCSVSSGYVLPDGNVPDEDCGPPDPYKGNAFCVTAGLACSARQ